LLPLFLAACGNSGETAGSVVDAAVDAAVNAPLDASADAAISTEAGEAGDDGGYCAATGPHYFCDDFDEDPLAHDWDQVTMEHGTLTLDASRATSSPYALLASSPALAAGAVTTAFLAKQIVDTPPQLHVTFDFAVDTPTALEAAATILVVDLLAADGTLAEVLSLQASPAGGTLVDSDDGGFVAQHPFPWSAVSRGAWSRIELDVVYADSGDSGDDDGGDGGALGGTVSVSVDGQIALAPVAMAPGAQPSLPVLELGLVSLAGPSAAIAVRFDDLTFATLR
jgi:hypothetical protein